MTTPTPGHGFTSTQALATHDRACALHGMISDAETVACSVCGRKPYDLADPDEHAVLLSLRKLAKQRRMSGATAVAAGLCVLASGLIDLATGNFPVVNAMRIFMVILGTSAVAVPVERVFRSMQPKALRAVDTKLLK